MSDIIKRLRQSWYGDDYGVSKDEICDERNREARQAADEIERLRAERDEARREVCELEAELPEERLVVWNAARMPGDLAVKRGWDCFKDGKP